MTILDKINNIREQKDAYVLPGNIKKDVTILNVTGALEEGDINALFENQNLTQDQLNLRYDLITAMSNLSTNGVRYQYWSATRLANSYMVPKLSNTSGFYSRYYNLRLIPSVPPFVVPSESQYSNCQRMFENCHNLVGIPTSCNFYNASDISYLFMNCFNLLAMHEITVNKAASPTSSVDVAGMFWHCHNLVYLAGLNLRYITSFTAMFSDCYNIKEITNLKLGFYKEFIPAASSPELGGCFRNCYNLTTVGNFETKYFTKAPEAFMNCYNINNLPNFSFNNLILSNYMFYRCLNLTNVAHLDFPKIEIAGYMFAYCGRLEDFPDIVAPNLYNVVGMFIGCNRLSDSAIQNIINMLLHSNVNSEYKTIYGSSGPFIYTNISNTRFQNRWAELDAAGWTY